MLTSILITNIGYAEEQVTVEWKYWGDVTNPSSYWRIWVTYSDERGTVQYDGWCADHTTTLPKSGSEEIMLYDSIGDIGDMPWDIKDDEEWDVINYIFNQWPTSDSGSPFYGATWKDIQQVVWIYTDDYNPSEGSQFPPAADNWDIVVAIRDHIDQLESLPSAIVMRAMVLDFNHPLFISGPRQLMFFVIPEIALGTLGAATTMIGAFIAKTRLGRSKKVE